MSNEGFDNASIGALIARDIANILAIFAYAITIRIGLSIFRTHVTARLLSLINGNSRKRLPIPSADTSAATPPKFDLIYIFTITRYGHAPGGF